MSAHPRPVPRPSPADPEPPFSSPWPPPTSPPAAPSAPFPGIWQRGIETPRPAGTWGLGAFTGKLGEISAGRASAALTLAFRLVREAQREREPAAWISRRERVFYPPDAWESGVDLDGLAVIWAAGALPAARAADLLVRSGGFGLVVLDLGEEGRLPMAAMGRLAGLAAKHRTAVICLTEKATERPSLGPLVSLRAEAVRAPGPEGWFLCRARVLKDKRGGPGREHQEIRRGPDGLH